MRYFFASDIHLGLELPGKSSASREAEFVRWLDMVKGERAPRYSGEKRGALFLLGDIFDFWYEWREVVPKGCVRTLGKLAEMCDAGIEVHIFKGNHDTWVRNYFTTEIGAIYHLLPLDATLCGIRCHICHGDGVYIKPSALGYRFMFWLFNNRVAFHIFSALVHPSLAMIFGKCWSKSSRKSKSIAHEFKGESEPIVIYARKHHKVVSDTQLYIFGHLHCPTLYPLEGTEQEKTPAGIAVLGEWIDTPYYGILDDSGFRLSDVVRG